MIFDAHLSRIYIQYSILYMLYTDKQIKTWLCTGSSSVSPTSRRRRLPRRLSSLAATESGKRLPTGHSDSSGTERYSGFAFLKHLLFSISERLVRASIAGADCFSEMYSSQEESFLTTDSKCAMHRRTSETSVGFWGGEIRWRAQILKYTPYSQYFLFEQFFATN